MASLSHLSRTRKLKSCGTNTPRPQLCSNEARECKHDTEQWRIDEMRPQHQSAPAYLPTPDEWGQETHQSTCHVWNGCECIFNYDT
jgi:hypothetical protein